jgi:hypothetical protein
MSEAARGGKPLAKRHPPLRKAPRAAPKAANADGGVRNACALLPCWRAAI